MSGPNELLEEVQSPTIEAAIDVPAAQVEHTVVEETRELAEERGVIDDG